jgi:hypothetical protein
MSTHNPPEPADHGRPFPYQQAGAFAVLLGALLLILTRDPGRALELAAGLLAVLVLHQLGQQLMRRLLARRLQHVWVAMAGPIAGTVAAYGAAGLYLRSGHAPLLDIALLGFCVTANATLSLTPPTSESGRLRGGLAGVSLGGAFTALLSSPWGVAVAIPVVVLCHFLVEHRLAVLSRQEAPVPSGAGTDAWIYGALAVLLAVALGVALCAIAFARVG